MNVRRANPELLLAATLILAWPAMHAQTPVHPPAQASDGVLVDQVIAVVNGDLILESDVDEERRFEVFQPLSDPGARFSRIDVVNRLIDRELILQQAKVQPNDKVTIPQAEAELKQLRTAIPECKEFHCETDTGWARFVADQGFTIPQLEERWRERMEILKFIEIRFRAGIRIEPAAIKDYYDKNLLPEYEKQHAAAPPLDTISDRIQEILLQQQVGTLLSDWLTTLKAQGSVHMMKPGEEVP
jgi:peptidyl-prolyl cis-trans isomerase SurA